VDLANGTTIIDTISNGFLVALSAIGTALAGATLWRLLRIRRISTSVNDQTESPRKEASYLSSFPFEDFAKALKDAKIEDEDRQFLLLKQYHDTGLQQSTVSFYISLVFAAIGFVVIILSWVTADKDLSLSQQGRALLAAFSGVVMDTVAALFIVQSNKARALMADFFDRLRSDRKLDQAVAMATELSDQDISSRLKAVLALRLVDAKASPSVLQAVIGGLPPAGLVTREETGGVD
jgi:hypothetical protein